MDTHYYTHIIQISYNTQILQISYRNIFTNIIHQTQIKNLSHIHKNYKYHSFTIQTNITHSRTIYIINLQPNIIIKSGVVVHSLPPVQKVPSSNPGFTTSATYSPVQLNRQAGRMALSFQPDIHTRQAAPRLSQPNV